MKKLFSFTLMLVMCLVFLSGCSPSNQPPTDVASPSPLEEMATPETSPTPPANPTTFRLASLKGPTTMGLVKLMSDSEAGRTTNNYDVTMYATADEIVTQLVNNEIDVAAVPCNLASVLYNKTQGAIKVAAINTLGVLYVVETGEQINAISDLKGKTIYTTGKGTTPEYALHYILAKNGLDPTKDVTIEFKSEATEVAALLSESSDAIAMLPQPFVTTAMSKNPNLHIALNMSEEWDKVSDDDSALVTGVVIARNAFIEENPEAFRIFLGEYNASTKYVTSNNEESARLVGKYEIVPEAIAKKALPLCNITFIEGKEMQSKVTGYLQSLFEQNPKAVGGTMPDAAFYYSK
ncbi:sulfonate/nitrate/taurine transporter substrate-binding protein [Sporanaerobium hydrogeniformans]|uniref:Sulfonate/nitrate/taurine transporter substrate-binding protein n=1 Tax=Sporanaerobium hydrogeniformans TaxID=3072179 RepID=A0AC61DDI6_9FIRM|nr:ABC transporter substrate-binding protein [Sporanaerobium hydrogeniformans]PHV70858.1 sulfonate/nitrate/taurine transporter substrate-binding protein [Sporanaerobium hydrogeniformans]